MTTQDNSELRRKLKAILESSGVNCDEYELQELISQGTYAIEAIMQAIQTEIDRGRQTDYLLHFSYVDWEVGDDDKLRVGDYINCNHQRPHDGYEQNVEGQIVAHYVNSLPVVLFNVDPKDPENSGDYADLQSLMMDGWEFSRINHLKANLGEGKKK